MGVVSLVLLGFLYLDFDGVLIGFNRVIGFVIGF
jgi:hypothetical protein